MKSLYYKTVDYEYLTTVHVPCQWNQSHSFTELARFGRLLCALQNIFHFPAKSKYLIVNNKSLSCCHSRSGIFPYCALASQNSRVTFFKFAQQDKRNFGPVQITIQTKIILKLITVWQRVSIMPPLLCVKSRTHKLLSVLNNSSWNSQ